MSDTEARNVNFKVIGLPRLEMELTIFRTQGKQANHYTMEVNFSRCYFLDYENKVKAVVVNNWTPKDHDIWH